MHSFQNIDVWLTLMFLAIIGKVKASDAESEDFDISNESQERMNIGNEPQTIAPELLQGAPSSGDPSPAHTSQGTDEQSVPNLGVTEVKVYNSESTVTEDNKKVSVDTLPTYPTQADTLTRRTDDGETFSENEDYSPGFPHPIGYGPTDEHMEEFLVSDFHKQEHFQKIKQSEYSPFIEDEEKEAFPNVAVKETNDSENVTGYFENLNQPQENFQPPETLQDPVETVDTPLVSKPNDSADTVSERIPNPYEILNHPDSQESFADNTTDLHASSSIFHKQEVDIAQVEDSASSNVSLAEVIEIPEILVTQSEGGEVYSSQEQTFQVVNEQELHIPEQHSEGSENDLTSIQKDITSIHKEHLISTHNEDLASIHNEDHTPSQDENPRFEFGDSSQHLISIPLASQEHSSDIGHQRAQRQFPENDQTPAHIPKFREAKQTLILSSSASADHLQEHSSDIGHQRTQRQFPENDQTPTQIPKSREAKQTLILSSSASTDHLQEHSSDIGHQRAQRQFPENDQTPTQIPKSREAKQTLILSSSASTDHLQEHSSDIGHQRAQRQFPENDQTPTQIPKFRDTKHDLISSSTTSIDHLQEFQKDDESDLTFQTSIEETEIKNSDSPPGLVSQNHFQNTETQNELLASSQLRVTDSAPPENSQETERLREMRQFPRQEPSEFADYQESSQELPQAGSIQYSTKAKYEFTGAKGTVPLFSPPQRRDNNLSLHPTPVEKDRGTPYKFSYTVRDPVHGTDFGHQEDSDGEVVTGEYYVVLPDGRKQTVQYTADHVNGFQSEVEYNNNNPSGLQIGLHPDGSLKTTSIENNIVQSLLGSSDIGNGQYQSGNGADSISFPLDNGPGFQSSQGNHGFPLPINNHDGSSQTNPSDLIFPPLPDIGSKDTIDIEGVDYPFDLPSGISDYHLTSGFEGSFTSSIDDYSNLDLGDAFHNSNSPNQFKSDSNDGGQLLVPHNDEQYQLSNSEDHIQVSDVGNQLQSVHNGDEQYPQNDINNHHPSSDEQYLPLADQPISNTDHKQYPPLESISQYQPSTSGNQHHPPTESFAYQSPTDSDPFQPNSGNNQNEILNGNQYVLPTDGDIYDQYQALDIHDQYQSHNDGQHYQLPDIHDRYVPTGANDQYQPSGTADPHQFFNDDSDNFHPDSNDNNQYGTSDDGNFLPPNNFNEFQPTTGTDQSKSGHNEHSFQPYDSEEHYQPSNEGDYYHSSSTGLHQQQPPNSHDFQAQSHFQAFASEDQSTPNENVSHIDKLGDENDFQPLTAHVHTQPCNCGG
ncbi:hypothetical protein SK128_009340 [Halocaridina rubra]|uniref:Uncharacterized protein n=1 Tax=Halocaridina rubra TaxID=373956 RepID=A0AAN9A421_HALRR